MDGQRVDGVDASYSSNDKSTPSGLTGNVNIIDDALTTVINSESTYTVKVGTKFYYDPKSRSITVPAKNNYVDMKTKKDENGKTQESVDPLSYSASTAHELGHASDHEKRPGSTDKFIDAANHRGDPQAVAKAEKMEEAAVKVEDAARQQDGTRTRGYPDNKPVRLDDDHYIEQVGEKPPTIIEDEGS